MTFLSVLRDGKNVYFKPSNARRKNDRISFFIYLFFVFITISALHKTRPCRDTTPANTIIIIIIIHSTEYATLRYTTSSASVTARVILIYHTPLCRQ